MSIDLLLEQCGAFFFSRLRPLFFFILLALPVVGAALFVFLAHGELQILEARFAQAARKEKISFERQAKKEKFLQHYSHADPYFLDQYIEPFPLLQKEKERLQLLLNHPAFPSSQSLNERLRFLQANRLAFTEENIRATATVKEVEEKQRYPVQMDEEDVRKILSLLEDMPIGPYSPHANPPQIIVKEMRIKKRTTPLQTVVFEVDMDLLKREFTTQ